MDKDKREAINHRLKPGRQLQWKKRQETNLDVSSQQENLLRKGKFLKRRHFLLKKYWQKRPASLEPWVWEPGTALIRPAGLLEGQPECLQTGDMGRSHPSSHSRPSQSLLPPVWGTYALCMSHPFLMFSTELTSKTATAQELWGYSSITSPIPQDVSSCCNLLIFLLFLCFVLFCHFNDIKSYKYVTLKDTFRRERSKLLSCLPHRFQLFIQLLQPGVKPVPGFATAPSFVSLVPNVYE